MQHANAVRKPEGGFVFITVRQLCRVWVAYQQRRIRLVDVWVWWAAHEVVAKRCQTKADQKRCYRVDELDRLVGSAHSMPQSLRRLAQERLLSWDEEQITFPEEATSMDEREALNAMLEQIQNHERRVPVPRRIIRYLAGGCRRVRMATVLGHLLRCLYYRAGQCCPNGHCKAPWIATVFGVGLRQVKRARQQLEQLGLVQRHDAPQWVLNHYGVDCTINLQWDGPPHDDEQCTTPSLAIAAAPAVVSSGLNRTDTAAVPVVLPVLAVCTATPEVCEDSVQQRVTPATRTAFSDAQVCNTLPAAADDVHAGREMPLPPAQEGQSGRLVALFTQAQADIRAGRAPLADVAHGDQRSQGVPCSSREEGPTARSPVAPLAAQLEAPRDSAPESTPTPLSPFVHDSSEAEQGMSHQAQVKPCTATRTEARPPEFHPLQTVLSTLNLPTVSSPIVDHPCSADAVRVGAAVALCHPLGPIARNVTPTSHDTPSEMTPLSDPKHHEIAPPESDRELSRREEKDQKPATHGGAGILSAMVLEVRAEMKAGVPARSAQTPVLNPSVSATLHEKRASRDEHEAPVALATPSAGTPVASVVKATAQPMRQTPSAALPPPTLRHILIQDLRDTTRLLQLYAHAVTAGLTGRSEADRLNFVALAHHVLSYRPENPGGLFTQLLRKHHFDYITQDDEDAAQRRLKRVLYGGTVPVLQDVSYPEQRRAG